MKKFFFQICCILLLIPANSYGYIQSVPSDKTIAFNTYYGTTLNGSNTSVITEGAHDNFFENIYSDKIGGHSVLFHFRRPQQLPEPIIKHETLKTIERLMSSPLVFVEGYPNFTLLILTTALYFLVVARRRQFEQLQFAKNHC